MNFVPQKTYGEHDRMVRWFRETLGVNGELFEAPGHQWNVFAIPKEIAADPAQLVKFKDGLGETLRAMQTYIILKGIGGRSGMEFSSFKTVHSDGKFANSPMNLGRGTVRTVEGSIFGPGLYGVELRAGTKRDETRRILQQALTSRAATGDFSGLAPVDSWALIPKNATSADTLGQKLGLDAVTVKKFIEALGGIKVSRGDRTKQLAYDYLLPLWNWEEAPYLSETKKRQLRELSRSFVESVVKNAPLTPSALQDMQQDWVKASNLEDDVFNYMKPKPPLVSTETLMRYPVVDKPGAVDVNAIDLGLEYTGRFPTKPRSLMSDAPIGNGRRGWIGGLYDMTGAERLSIMENTARDLAQSFGAAPSSITSEVGGHGHGLGAAYFARDPATNGKWRVEWDGVTREYDLENKVVPESIRGGHVEVVTPKTKLTGRDVDNVFNVFAKQGLVPDTASGGGHINFDLEPFKGQPKKFARFLARFLENRGTIALMFQHVDRLKSAEPLAVSPGLIANLKNFEGTEAELKKLLYNERWFNQRVGRKSRYTQIDIASYFQDVIPAEFVSKDFDLFNDVWRQNFRVEPHIRKAEFRLFNAPRTSREAALQTKLVRAMLNDALNETSPLSGSVQKVDFTSAVKNPKKAEADFAETMARLKLDPAEYREYLLDGLDTARERINSVSYTSLEERLAKNPEIDGWRTAVSPRGDAAALSSEARTWDGKNVHPSARKFYDERMAGRAVREELEQAAKKRDFKRLRRALSEKGSVDAWRQLPEEDLLPFLSSFAESSDAQVRQAAEKALREVRAKVSYPALLEMAVPKAASPGFAKFLVGELIKLPGGIPASLVSLTYASAFDSLSKLAAEKIKSMPSATAQQVLIEQMDSFVGASFDTDGAAKWQKFYDSFKFPLPAGSIDPRVEKLNSMFRSADEWGLYGISNFGAELERSLNKESQLALADMFMNQAMDEGLSSNARGYARSGFFKLKTVLEDTERLSSLLSHVDADIVERAGDALIRNLNAAYGAANFEKRLSLLNTLKEKPATLRMKALTALSYQHYRDPVGIAPVLAEVRRLDFKKLLETHPKETSELIRTQMLAVIEQDFKRLLPAKAENFLTDLYRYPTGAEIIDRSIASAINNAANGRLEILRWVRQNVKAPSKAILDAMEKAATVPELRDSAIAALMQWPEGTRVLAGKAWSDSSLRKMISSEPCQRHFERFGTATSL
ncbi:MAG: hypothetical protein EOP11_01495 [Proteobacteria bacterium]|nr:MAG: hypothetical protein EOP11_01495 [Pseudomonadota bacterium]